MAYKITWLPTTEKRFNQIIAYLEKEWTIKEIEALLQKTNDVPKCLTPNLPKISKQKNT